ncbi:MAG TPA: TIGR04551 family protein [Polyangiaceae bacterium]|nr:TIGR04551 family protein [Polyangiaceae bacterium]
MVEARGTMLIRHGRALPLLLALGLLGFAPLTYAPAARAQGAAPGPTVEPTARGNLMPAASPAGAVTVAPSAPAPDPDQDQRKLVAQGEARPDESAVAGVPSSVFSDDWWGRTRPVLELHGYFRTRGELFHNFALGRFDNPGDEANLWAHPLDHTYNDKTGAARTVNQCGDNGTDPCFDKTQASANMRLRLNPEIHISDNLRILSQVDFLNNVVLGSTPDAYAIQPSGTGSTGYRPAVNGYNGYAPLGTFSTTQGPPTAGVNGYKNSIDVQRAWAEYLTPVGQLRFGRLPLHWGLGMLANSGDRIDDDWQSNSDRIMFVTGIKSLDLYFGGSWDFISSGATNASPYDVYGGQPYNTANLTNAGQWSLLAVHRTNPELQRLKLAKGDMVVNGGVFALYRSQYLDVKAGENPLTNDSSATDRGLERRGAQAFVPDAWLQVLYRKFRFEAEFASVLGQIAKSPAKNQINDPIGVRQFGLATQTEYKAIEDKLRVGFGFGWASGDGNVEGLAPGANGLQVRKGDGPISTFRFHPSYYVDYIFHRRILSRVEGTYYFRPSVEYDFLRNPNGQKFGGGAAIIWSRASQFIQAPGNKRDLGIELDLQLYYQAKDGTLNDDPSKMGGFYSALQYGVFFPLGGLSYLPGEQSAIQAVLPPNGNQAADVSLSTAQTVRLILGVMF